MSGPDIYENRWAFVDSYCDAKSWDSRDLTWEQITEIRSQPEWANPPTVAEQAETVVKRKGRNLFIYEDGEFCCVCKSVEDLQNWGFGDPDDPLKFTVCMPCHDGQGFHDWLCGEFEHTMIIHDENRKLSDGKWTTNKYDPETATPQ